MFQKKRKQKKLEKKRLKALELETAKNQAKKRKFSGGLEIEPPTAGQEPDDQPKKPYKVQEPDLIIKKATEQICRRLSLDRFLVFRRIFNEILLSHWSNLTVFFYLLNPPSEGRRPRSIPGPGAGEANSVCGQRAHRRQEGQGVAAGVWRVRDDRKHEVQKCRETGSKDDKEGD